MFGLESTVMLPWQAGVPVHAGQPLLAADLEAALREAGRRAWWMTTPALMRAPLGSGASFSRLDGIVASTMALPPVLAQAAEQAWGAPVVEVYGSTETGALATRRTAVETDWRPLAGVVLREQGEGETRRFLAEGPHLVAPVELGDALELRPGGRFRWLGRAGDMVKIGGRRGSLAALGLALSGIPGVTDGAFALPPGAIDKDEREGAVRRLTAFYVSEVHAPAHVLAQLRARIDPAFLPRPLHRVSRVPRDANGKLTRAGIEDLFALVPAAQRIASDHPSLAGHFPGAQGKGP
jgi:acyl-coenzyme A synthetase/AMP-(fatty) acid ligase